MCLAQGPQRSDAGESRTLYLCHFFTDFLQTLHEKVLFQNDFLCIENIPWRGMLHACSAFIRLVITLCDAQIARDRTIYFVKKNPGEHAPAPLATVRLHIVTGLPAHLLCNSLLR